ncbi:MULTISPECIES: hypothetical protein [Pseudomonas]|uniref:hypothetical protein n=1 Tax=Pseudomonas TaxID=286 RepID=UPI000A21F624|nr:MULTISPECIES: hypothetical protein [Pseudomonas]OSR65024.1 hypothetical protein BV327_05522 [Pseudomonas syringae pv. actinidiae]PHN30698.1 hypothetical protein AO240_18495 [Pseudomonas sp. ICMP 460]
MALSQDEQGRIGLALHLTHHQYNAVTEGWGFELPTDYQMSVEAVTNCRYVAFSLDGRWDAVAKIGTWQLSMDGGGKRTAELSAFSKVVSGLRREITTDPTKTRWLHLSQQEALETAIADESTITRPEAIPACLDMEEASNAIARHYGVEAEQIQISIHRKIATGSVEKQE